MDLVFSKKVPKAVFSVLYMAGNRRMSSEFPRKRGGLTSEDKGQKMGQLHVQTQGGIPLRAGTRRVDDSGNVVILRGHGQPNR